MKWSLSFAPSLRVFICFSLSLCLFVCRFVAVSVCVWVWYFFNLYIHTYIRKSRSFLSKYIHICQRRNKQWTKMIWPCWWFSRCCFQSTAIIFIWHWFFSFLSLSWSILSRQDTLDPFFFATGTTTSCLALTIPWGALQGRNYHVKIIEWLLGEQITTIDFLFSVERWWCNRSSIDHEVRCLLLISDSIRSWKRRIRFHYHRFVHFDSKRLPREETIRRNEDSSVNTDQTIWFSLLCETTRRVADTTKKFSLPEFFRPCSRERSKDSVPPHALIMFVDIIWFQLRWSRRLLKIIKFSWILGSVISFDFLIELMRDRWISSSLVNGIRNELISFSKYAVLMQSVESNEWMNFFLCVRPTIVIELRSVDKSFF